MQQPDEVAPSRGDDRNIITKTTTEKNKKEAEEGLRILRKDSDGGGAAVVVPGATSVSASGTATSLASYSAGLLIESTKEGVQQKATRRADAGKSNNISKGQATTTCTVLSSWGERAKQKARHADKEGASVPPPSGPVISNNSNLQDDEETMVEAELAVDHTDEIQAARDENEALRRRVEALESGEIIKKGGAVLQQQEVGQKDAAIVVVAIAANSPSADEENNESDDQDDEDDDDEGDANKRRMVMFGSLIIIVIALALAVVLRTGSDPVEVVADPTTSPVSIPITSSSPTEALLFEKPTEEECNQVRNGNQVQGQEKMPVQNFDIMVDVNVDASVAVADQTHWDELESRIQAAMVPILVGCTSINSSRRRRYLASSRYVVANAVTCVVPLVGQSCVLEQRENDGDGVCVPVRVNLDVYLKGSEFDVSLLIQQLLLEYVKGDVPLVELLEPSPGTPFLSIVITSVNSNNPTEAPSTGPTRLPSVVPTIAPSLTPSARPTLRQSSNPTGAPSAIPTISCPENCAGDMNAGNACDCADPSRIGCGSCLGWWACTGDFLDVKRNSCIGDEACMGVSGVGFIGDNSCTGNNACRDLSGAVGDNSCNGPNDACGGFSGDIGDNSCNGVGACGNSYGFVTKTLTVGNGSCNCEDCCSCLPDNAKVPDNSCNTRDGFRDFFSGGKGPYEVCCPSDPSSTGGPSPSPTYDVCGHCCCEIQSTVGTCGTAGCSSEVCADLDCSNYLIPYY